MGGDAFCHDSELPSPLNQTLTVVLVGKTGNGKSSTGNSLLGSRAFKSKSSSGSVTTSSELQYTLLESRSHFLNVIDTPGLFDFSGGGHQVVKEISKCIEMAKDGIHAIVFVLSVRSRFSQEEEAAIKGIVEIFGPKITDYMILLFTGGDDLEEDEQTLEDYLDSEECPNPLKEIISKCRRRCVLFDNKTRDEFKKHEQRENLLTLVDDVVKNNGGKPYTNKLFEMQRELSKKTCSQGEAEVNSSELKELRKSYEEQLKISVDMIEKKMSEQMKILDKQLAKDRSARLKAEKEAKKIKDKFNEMKDKMHQAEREADSLRQEVGKVRCVIM